MPHGAHRLTTLYGFEPAPWDQAVSAGYAYLAEVAGRAAITSYQEFSAQVFDRAGFRVSPNDAALGGLLAAVARRSQAAKSVILPAVLLSTDQGQPGTGFFAFAREIGLLDKRAKQDAKFEFWAEHLTMVFAAYASE